MKVMLSGKQKSVIYDNSAEDDTYNIYRIYLPTTHFKQN